MKIDVVGAGYVGLVTSCCLAEAGNDVLCMDTDAAKVEGLTKGLCPIYEPQLAELLQRNVADGRLRFSNPTERRSEFLFCCVGTPTGANGKADLSALNKVVERVSTYSKPVNFVIKSTVPVGTAREVRRLLEHKHRVYSNPEFLREGRAVADFMRPNRVVIGSLESTDHPTALLNELYAPFVRSGAPVLHMSNESAELTKYAANAMLATRISFMNLVADLASATGADVEDVRKAIATDERIGPHFLYPGVGFGGSCFSKDVLALREMCCGRDISADMLSSVLAQNQAARRRPYQWIRGLLGANGLLKARIAIWGLAFKPYTDDLRDAPALDLCRSLFDVGATVVVHDPAAGIPAGTFDREVLSRPPYSDHPGKVLVAASHYEAARDADALIVMTEWPEYRMVDWEKLRSSMRSPRIYDARNIYNRAEVVRAGLLLWQVGR